MALKGWRGTATRCATAIAVAGVLGSCSHDVRSQAHADSGIDAGASLNTQTGSYRVPGVDVTLVKVVALPNDMLGLRFAFDTKSPDCCSLFPRLALTQSPDTPANAATTDIVVPKSDVQNGMLAMRLWDRTADTTSPFVVDLASLGVPVNA